MTRVLEDILAVRTLIALGLGEPGELTVDSQGNIYVGDKLLELTRDQVAKLGERVWNTTYAHSGIGEPYPGGPVNSD